MSEKCRLITRSDFDGLVCAMILKELDLIEDIKFVHPKDMQDGKIPVTDKDITTNLPYVPGVKLAFDHHSSEHERMELEGKYKGESRITPSCARIIYEYYGGKERFPQFGEM
ncbi:MAG: exopolyphosphatase, partial [Acetivibrio ethanolgignens]